jgi:hypothetical protein
MLRSEARDTHRFSRKHEEIEVPTAIHERHFTWVASGMEQ